MDRIAEFGIEKLQWLHYAKGSSDKVWGWFVYRGAVLTFWGRRLGPFSFKVMAGMEEAVDRFYAKKLHGYVCPQTDDIDGIIVRSFILALGKGRLKELGEGVCAAALLSA